MLTQEPRHKGIDQWMIQEIEELSALVNQGPYPLVGAAAVLFAHTRLILAGCLLLDGLLQDGVLLGRQGVFEKTISELDNVALDLINILRGLRQTRESAWCDLFGRYS